MMGIYVVIRHLLSYLNKPILLYFKFIHDIKNHHFVSIYLNNRFLLMLYFYLVSFISFYILPIRVLNSKLCFATEFGV